MKRKTKSEIIVLESEMYQFWTKKDPVKRGNFGVWMPGAVEQTHEPVDLESTKVVYSYCEMCTYESIQRVNDV